jgi:RNA-directed DNA polymerase
MRREPPVRIREGLGVQFPRATRLVIGLANEEDARRLMEVLPKRFEKYGLKLHPDKTRLVPFQRPGTQSTSNSPGAESSSGTFDLLGFRHYWGKSRYGNWVVKRKTMPSRFGRALKKIAAWSRQSRHLPLPDQHRALKQKLIGHYGYFGITGNADALQRFRTAVFRLWRTWLSRRHRRPVLSWATFTSLLQHYPLPPPRVVHSVYRS